MKSLLFSNQVFIFILLAYTKDLPTCWKMMVVFETARSRNVFQNYIVVTSDNLNPLWQCYNIHRVGLHYWNLYSSVVHERKSRVHCKCHKSQIPHLTLLWTVFIHTVTVVKLQGPRNVFQTCSSCENACQRQNIFTWKCEALFFRWGYDFMKTGSN